MNSLIIEFPDAIHKTLIQLSHKKKISINELVAEAVEEKIESISSLEYLEKRAKRGSKAKFLRAMAKVPSVLPEEYDSL
jgi:hypothetical protein